MTRTKPARSKKAISIEALPPKAMTAEDAKTVKGGSKLTQAQHDAQKGIIANIRV